MGIKNIYERFIWFGSQGRAGKYPNTTSLANQFEVSMMEILKHGDMVEVIKPKSLRKLIRTKAEKIAQID